MGYTYLPRPKVVQRRQEDRKRRVNADYPCESNQIIERRDRDRDLRDDDDRPEHRLPESISQFPTPPLRDADHAHESRPPRWLLLGGDTSVVVRFVNEEDDCEKAEDDCEKAEAGLEGVDAEGDLPFLGRDYEGCD